MARKSNTATKIETVNATVPADVSARAQRVLELMAELDREQETLKDQMFSGGIDAVVVAGMGTISTRAACERKGTDTTEGKKLLEKNKTPFKSLEQQLADAGLEVPTKTTIVAETLVYKLNV